MLIKIHRGWEIAEREVTPERVYLDRRKFLTGASLTAAATLGGYLLPEAFARQTSPVDGPYRRPLSAPRNPEYKTDRPITSEKVSAGYNNYYEFSEIKDQVWKMAEDFEARPWQIEVKGLVEKPLKIDVDDLIKKFPLEERVYRHRCVERWVVIIPWIGFPMKKFVAWCNPQPKARYVRMVSFFKPMRAPGQRNAPWYPWPYFEGLTMEEATNELALLVVGMYGKTLTNQNGAPIRLHTPWKYGYKSIKAMTLFEFVEKQPATFWNKTVPSEYDFVSNVDPRKPHPRWSQAYDQLVETREVVPTKLYNGYEKYVASLYR